MEKKTVPEKWNRQSRLGSFPAREPELGKVPTTSHKPRVLRKQPVIDNEEIKVK
jgi:hypothetical protein